MRGEMIETPAYVVVQVRPQVHRLEPQKAPHPSSASLSSAQCGPPPLLLLVPAHTYEPVGEDSPIQSSTVRCVERRAVKGDRYPPTHPTPTPPPHNRLRTD